jgi:hypothetical protein
MTREHADAMQVARIVTMLQENFNTTKGDYNSGWSDTRVATEIGCGANSVANIRTKHFGKLINKNSNPQVVKALADQQALIDALTEDMSKLRTDFIQLVGVVRYHVTEVSLKNALATIEKRYPLARGLLDTVADTSRMKGNKHE